MIIKKQYARREILQYISPYADPFTYISYSEENRPRFIEVLGQIEAASLGRDFLEVQPKDSLDEMIEFAGPVFKPEFWRMAFIGEEPAGLVFAQQYWDKLIEGSLFFIGVMPAFYGKGYGKILHARGLEDLASIGVEQYVGSTDIENTPMIHIFEQNGCRLYAIREIEVPFKTP